MSTNGEKWAPRVRGASNDDATQIPRKKTRLRQEKHSIREKRVFKGHTARKKD